MQDIPLLLIVCRISSPLDCMQDIPLLLIYVRYPLLLIVCRIFLSSWLYAGYSSPPWLFVRLHFSHDRSNWSSASFSLSLRNVARDVQREGSISGNVCLRACVRACVFHHRNSRFLHIMRQSCIVNEKGNELSAGDQKCRRKLLRLKQRRMRDREKSGHTEAVIEFGHVDAGCDRCADWVLFSGKQAGRQVIKKIKRIRRTFQQKPRGWGMSCLQRPFVLPMRIMLLHQT